MIRGKFLRFTIVLAALALSVLRGYGAGVIYATPSDEKAPLIKSNLLLESKGLIEPAVEIGNSASFQHSFHKIKKSGGYPASLSVKLRSHKYFTRNTTSCFSGWLAIPRYLFNRRILI